jgi:hypothetical protein
MNPSQCPPLTLTCQDLSGRQTLPGSVAYLPNINPQPISAQMTIKASLTIEIFNIKAFDTAKECEADKAARIKTAQQEFYPAHRPLTPQEEAYLLDNALPSFCTFYK